MNLRVVARLALVSIVSGFVLTAAVLGYQAHTYQQFDIYSALNWIDFIEGFAVNTVMIFIAFIGIGWMNTGINRRNDLKSLNYAALRILGIFVAWMLILAIMTLGWRFLSQGWSLARLLGIALLLVGSTLRIWQAGR